MTQLLCVTPSSWLRSIDAVDAATLASLFDEHLLQQHNFLTGIATAGRGNTFFFQWQDHDLVLRHYRRGGLVQKISRERYVFTSLESTRAFKEFDVLEQLQHLALPAPVPFACQVIKHGLLYSASIVTYRLAGKTLAERLALAPLSEQIWRSVGQCIAQFHRAGLWHADLNAHNIMLNDDDKVYLIDFDRARFRDPPASPANRGWCSDNIQRLNRSLVKLVGQGRVVANDSSAIASGSRDIDHSFRQLESTWSSALSD